MLFHRPILSTLAGFFHDLRNDPRRHSFWQGLLIVILILVAALVLLEAAGRQVTLISLGVFCLLVTITNLFKERRVSRAEATRL